MFREVATVVGHCCHFDMAHFRLVSTDLMYVFDADNKVSKMTNFISMSESKYYDIDIDLFVIDASADVKALSLRKRKCSLNSDHGISANQNCIAMLLMIKVVNYCRCLPFMYTAEDLYVENFPNCTWEQHLCINSQYEKASGEMQSLIGIHDCYQRCDYVEYDPKAESIRRIRTGQNDTYTEVAIAYAASTCMKYRREVIYTWDQMLANLGGIFGLCLGGSIISVIEIVWFLMDLLITTYTFKEKKPQTKIFVIEQNVSNKNDKSEKRYKFVK
ncbi:uncharacterized protein LOC133519533 [Cydia pomonella]|uniref:uncharacterized protein LOC133519533 n=1 Tax=Cydia pomonella TaxID=82600 RepID=UPI002ADE60A6|nr:uncharacterized protein LOC133519533 [Cydia pomonella]